MVVATRQDSGGGHQDMDAMHERWRALLEMLAGMGLASLPFWSHLLESIITGAQAIATICGAVIAVSGVYRLFFRKQRRKSDSGESPNARRQGAGS